jgi:neutral ceramidase
VGDLGRIDPDFCFMVVQQAQGKSAVLGSYGAHATVLPSSVMEFSGDYPGYWQRAIEEATGGLALFFAGGMGSHRPEAGARGFAGAERMGQGLARSVLEQLPSVQLTNTVTLGIVGLDVEMPELHARLTDGLRLRPWLAKRLLPVADHTFLQVFRLDRGSWVSTPCDFSGELALGIKESGRLRGIETVITSFNGDYIGYVIPHRYYHLEGYEPRLMSFFGPNVPDYFEELIRVLVAQLNPP